MTSAWHRCSEFDGTGLWADSFDIPNLNPNAQVPNSRPADQRCPVFRSALPELEQALLRSSHSSATFLESLAKVQRKPGDTAERGMPDVCFVQVLALCRPCKMRCASGCLQTAGARQWLQRSAGYPAFSLGGLLWTGSGLRLWSEGRLDETGLSAPSGIWLATARSVCRGWDQA